MSQLIERNVPGSAPRTRRKQADRRQESTLKMLDAALELLGERRSLGFSLADVADRAGYSRGQPSHIFGSRDEMIRQLVPHLHVRSHQLFGDPDERGTGLEAILRTASLLIDDCSAQADVTIAVHVLFAEAASAQSAFRVEVAALNAAAVDYIAHHLEAAERTGEIVAVSDRQAKAMLIMATIRGAVLQWRVAPVVSINALRKELIESLERDLCLSSLSRMAPISRDGQLAQ